MFKEGVQPATAHEKSEDASGAGKSLSSSTRVLTLQPNSGPAAMNDTRVLRPHDFPCITSRSVEVLLAHCSHAYFS